MPVSDLSVMHISDLHFGKQDDHKKAAILAFAQSHRPDLICITGDIVDAPRRRFFALAKDFIQQLGNLCDNRTFLIPGNHDAFLRSLSLRKFKQAFSSQLEYGKHIEINGDDVCIFGIDSTHFSLSHLNNSGRFSELSRRKLMASINELRNQLGTQRFDRAFKMALVHHHPLPTGKSQFEEMLYFKHSGKFLAIMAQNRIDLVLHGHQHDPHYYKLDYNLGSDTDPLVVLSAGTASKNDASEPSEKSETGVSSSTQFFHIRVSRDRRLSIEEYRYHYPTKEFVNSRYISINRRRRPHAFRKDHVQYTMCKNGDLDVAEKRTLAAHANRSIDSIVVAMGVDDKTPGCERFEQLNFVMSSTGRHRVIENTEREKRVELTPASPITTTPAEICWSYRWPGGFKRLLEDGADEGMISLRDDLDQLRVEIATEIHKIVAFDVIYHDPSRLKVEKAPMQCSFEVTKPSVTDVLYFRIRAEAS